MIRVQVMARKDAWEASCALRYSHYTGEQIRKHIRPRSAVQHLTTSADPVQHSASADPWLLMLHAEATGSAKHAKSAKSVANSKHNHNGRVLDYSGQNQAMQLQENTNSNSNRVKFQPSSKRPQTAPAHRSTGVTAETSAATADAAPVLITGKSSHAYKVRTNVMLA